MIEEQGGEGGLLEEAANDLKSAFAKARKKYK